MTTKTSRFRLTPVNRLEIDRQAEVIRYLSVEPRVKFFLRINGGGRFISGAWVWFYKLFVPGYEPAHGKGVSDLIGVLRDGRFFALEVKRPGEKPSANQAAFLALVREAGGAAGVVERWEDARELLRGETK